MHRIQEDNMSILIPDGEIHGQNVDELEGSLKQILEENVRYIAIDLAKVKYIYSRGIGAIIKTQKALKEKSGALYLFNLNQSLQRILMESNIMGYLNCCSSREEIDFELNNTNIGKDDDSLELGLSIEVISKQEKLLILKIAGTIDSEIDVRTLRKTCQEAIQNGYTEVHMDLSDLVYIDDMASMELINLSKQLSSYSGRLKLKATNEIVLDQLGTMGIKGEYIFEK
ncbi:MAG: STAS domain-containing protein [Fibrobacteria bacterium]|nr:STAS domain-containing protein [Fibrobacteria bacterium]